MRLSLAEGTIRSSNKGPKEEEDEKNIALASKGKAKKVPSQGQGSMGGKKNKKDPSKVKCFTCGEFGQYVSQCPKRKKDQTRKQTTSSAEIDELQARLDEFALIVAIPPSGGA